MFDLSVFKEIGYVTKMATVPISVKNSSNIFTQAFKGLIILGFVCVSLQCMPWGKDCKV